MAEIGKLNMYSYKDREMIKTLPCAFCGEYEISFRASEGYESHFSDSNFNCLKCGCSYPIDLFENKTLEECKNLMERRAGYHYQWYVEQYKEKLEEVTRIKKRLEMYESNYNPSKRDLLGKEN